MSSHPENLDGREAERRWAKRKHVNEAALLWLPGQVPLQPCRVRDLTVFGAGLSLEKLTLLPTAFELSFDGFRTTFHCRLVWRKADRAGVEFRTSKLGELYSEVQRLRRAYADLQRLRREVKKAGSRQ